MATLKTCLVAATAVLLFAAVIAPLAAASPVRAGQADAPKASPGRTVFRRSCAECASDDYCELWAEGTPQGHVACVKYGSHEHLYRRYESAAVVSTFAGNRVCSNSGDSGLATDATLHGPFAICLDSSNNVYVSSGYSTIRKIDVTTNIITTYAGGNGMGSSGDGGPATSAQLNWPSMCAFDKDDNLLIAHYENRVRMVNRTSGIITTFAGDGTDGTSGDGGPATSAQVGWPWGVAVGSDNTVYIGQATGQRVRKVSGGQIDLLASIGNNPTALLEYDASNLLVATVNYVILQPTSGSAKAVFLGNGTKVDGGDGTTATTASVNEPYGLAKDPQGNVYVSTAAHTCVARRHRLDARRRRYLWRCRGRPGAVGRHPVQKRQGHCLRCDEEAPLHRGGVRMPRAHDSVVVKAAESLRHAKKAAECMRRIKGTASSIFESDLGFSFEFGFLKCRHWVEFIRYSVKGVD